MPTSPRKHARTSADVDVYERVGLPSAAVTDSAAAGWTTFDMPPYGASAALARAALDDDGRAVITDLYLHGPALRAETLRGISISRLEARLTQQAARDPETRASLRGPQDDSLTVGELLKEAARVADQQRELRAAGIARRPLGRPDGTDPDEFYRLVSRAYGEYATETNAPAKAIAEEAGVPVTTVHRWIREARRRGFLPPARKGRAG